MLQNWETKKCIDGAFFSDPSHMPILFECDWNSVIRKENLNQFWQWDRPGIPVRDSGDDPTTAPSGRIFTFDAQHSLSLTGTDLYPVQRHGMRSKGARCLFTSARKGSRTADVIWKLCTEAWSGEGDGMRFVPKWEKPRMSSRFGRRNLDDAKKITDESAIHYLTSGQ